MNPDTVQQIAVALERAAGCRRLLPYQRFHAIFEPTMPLARRYALLDQAVSLLVNRTGLDYGAVLTLDNGLPGAEFFQRFKRYRYSDFIAVMGSPLHEKSLKRKRLLATAERQRVFANAAARVHDDAQETQEER
jgi:hypothetical protein